MAGKLTPKQIKFIDEYLIDLNATQAAIRAGYSKKTAQRIGSENLSKPLLQAEIQKRQKKLQNRLEITQEKVLSELASIAFASGADFAKVKSNGLLPSVEMVETDKLPPEKLAAIAGIKANQYGVEVKLHDKVRALEMLGKYLGLFDSAGGQEHPENNLLEAINACNEEGLNEIPEIQSASKNDAAVVENESLPK